MPYPNEHACRLSDPRRYERLRRKNCADKTGERCIDIIYGIENESVERQALRFPISAWPEQEAREYCKAEGGQFDPAAKENDMKTTEARKAIYAREHDVLSFPVELRNAGEGEEERKIVGRPAIFNQLSRNLGGFRERILPGAFTKTLQESNAKALWNHDKNYVLGSMRSGTLSITEDIEGLSFEAMPPDTQWARDFMQSVERGDVDQMSFRFRAVRDRWTKDEENNLIRELVEVQLIEVSPVTFPAYPQTSVDLREMGAELDPEVIEDVAMRAATGNLTDDDRAQIAEIRSVLDRLAAPAESHPEEEGEAGSDEPREIPDYAKRERELARLM